MRPQALGYIAISARSLDDWAGYAPKFIGLQKVDSGGKTIAFRMDDRRQRLVVEEDGGSTIKTYGWEMADAEALAAMAARLEQAGLKVEPGTRALADERRVRDLVILHDPAGNRLELFHGAEVASDPFVPGRNISGFRTGPLGIGHTVLHSARIDEMIAFYRDVMGFGVSDFYDKPFKACFFHVNGRHHSFAVIEHTQDMVHHLMMEYCNLDDMGQGYDLAQSEEGRIAVTIGRHAGDYVMSYYTWTPSKFMIECGWGGKQIDPATWTPGERAAGPSIWGHDRLWMSPEKRKEAREICLRNARDGLRQPVQVIEGNFDLLPGVVPRP
ncbi:VOC family protein [Roseiarcaceae bacterium H3SJ34-1]|uniref:VOC family protein n=1 Tax=Terripilifer ovatus TaxID=3032367 RepID=UPI003AB93561|nr:VOC family protein [Roseiarcaceae bacterium H3SJ34-1]